MKKYFTCLILITTYLFPLTSFATDDLQRPPDAFSNDGQSPTNIIDLLTIIRCSADYTACCASCTANKAGDACFAGCDTALKECLKTLVPQVPKDESSFN